MSSSRNTPEAHAPSLLLDASELASELRVSLRQVRRMDAAGRLPRPVRLGAAVRWARDEIYAWVEAGCPDRLIWEKREVE